MASFSESYDELSRSKSQEISLQGVILSILPGRSYVTKLVRQLGIQLQTRIFNRSSQTELCR
jgi:hypothetical protein